MRILRTLLFSFFFGALVLSCGVKGPPLPPEDSNTEPAPEATPSQSPRPRPSP